VFFRVCSIVLVEQCASVLASVRGSYQRVCCGSTIKDVVLWKGATYVRFSTCSVQCGVALNIVMAQGSF
jgi:hypothetical protein